jgi:hypothetical protein
MRHCCEHDCTKEAQFEIINTTPGADPYDQTDACEDHVGQLLGSTNEVPATTWAIVAL